MHLYCPVCNDNHFFNAPQIERIVQAMQLESANLASLLAPPPEDDADVVAADDSAALVGFDSPYVEDNYTCLETFLSQSYNTAAWAEDIDIFCAERVARMPPELIEKKRAHNKKRQHQRQQARGIRAHGARR